MPSALDSATTMGLPTVKMSELSSGAASEVPKAVTLARMMATTIGLLTATMSEMRLGASREALKAIEKAILTEATKVLHLEVKSGPRRRTM